MRFMNDCDIDNARDDWAGHPVLGPATRTLASLRDAADANSDGWAYWPKPARAAARLMELIERDGTARWLPPHNPTRPDATPAEYARACAVLKAFRTRSGLPFEIHER
jgi:hypothetical protein